MVEIQAMLEAVERAGSAERCFSLPVCVSCCHHSAFVSGIVTLGHSRLLPCLQQCKFLSGFYSMCKLSVTQLSVQFLSGWALGSLL